MKKVCKIMIFVFLILMASGCKNETSPTNGNENVLSLSKTEFKVTADDLYQVLKDKYATNYLIQQIDTEILNKEYKTDNEAKDYAENQIKVYKMMYGNSDSQLLSTIQNAGYKDLNEFKEALILSYKRTLATKNYLKGNVTEDQIKKYYDNNVYGDITLSHILIKLDIKDDMTDEQKKEAEKKVSDKIKEIYEKLNDKNFAEIAKEYSEDSATKDNGGKLGTFSKEEMIEKFNSEFEEAAKDLKVNSYTKKTIKSSYGYHIIYKSEQKDKPALDKIKDTIINKLVDEALEKDTKAEYKAMIKLREDYGLTFNDDTVKNQYEIAKNNWLYGKDN